MGDDYEDDSREGEEMFVEPQNRLRYAENGEYIQLNCQLFKEQDLTNVTQELELESTKTEIDAACADFKVDAVIAENCYDENHTSLTKL